MAARQSTFENVTIALEHDIDEQYQYQPGEIIRGKIGVHLHRSTLVESVYITITGDGMCNWEEDIYGSFWSRESYINATQAIVDSSQTARHLDKGYHDFPFEYHLPDNIPSSFIGKYGSVTYILKVTVKGERPSDTTIATEPFLVMRKYLLPEDVCEPQDMQQGKIFFAMCSWGKLKVKVHMDKTGFVPGDDLCLDAEVFNRCPLRVTAMQASLVMSSTYHAQKNNITYRQIVNKRRDDYELDEGDSRRWQAVRIGIPPYIPESFLQSCDIIDLSYIFQFRVELVGGKELKIEIPIIIGSNPKGLEIPADYDNNVNKHWTMGPRDLVKQQIADQHELKDKWSVTSPEFRATDTQVSNPLYRSDSTKKPNKEPDNNTRL